MGVAQALCGKPVAGRQIGNEMPRPVVTSRANRDSRSWFISDAGGRGPLYELIAKNGGGVIVIRKCGKDVVTQTSEDKTLVDDGKRRFTSHEFEFVAEHLGAARHEVPRVAIAELNGFAQVARFNEFGNRHTGAID